MTTIPLKLAKDDFPSPCAKCLINQRADKNLNIALSTNVLIQGAKRVPLCNNHSAQSANLHNIYHKTFNPNGKKTSA